MTTFIRITIFGIVAGSVFFVAASGLVLTYTTTGIFNFAHGAIGMLAAFLYWQLHVADHWPTLVALAFVLLVCAPLTGIVLERFLIRPLEGAPLAATLVVTIGLLVGCIGIAQAVWDPGVSRNVPSFFGTFSGFHVLGVFVSWHRFITIVCAVLIAIGLRILLRRTRIGITMRAVVDDRDLTSLTGARPDRAGSLSWILGCMLAALAGILLAPVLALDAVALTLLVLDAYAAAVVGRLRSLPLTFLGAMILGLVQSYVPQYLPNAFPHDVLPGYLTGLRETLPVLMLVVVLLLLPESRLRGAVARKVTAVKVASLKQSLVGGALLVAAALVAVNVMNGRTVDRMGLGLAYALIVLSLVPLTGYAGQVSLCPLAFAGLGAFAYSAWGGSGTPWGLLLAVALPAAVSVVIALPALRLSGLYLALITLAFAVALDNMVFPQKSVFWVGTVTAPRFHWAGVSLQSDRAWFVLLAVVYALLAIGVLALRRGAFGRRLIAMRDSQAACATLGLDRLRTKLLVFALSAGMAGLGGALFAGLKVGVGAQDFTMVNGLAIFLLVVIGGVETGSGALIGGFFFAITLIIGQDYPSWNWLPLVAPALIGIGLARNPNGASVEIARSWHDLTARRRRAAPAPAGPALVVEGSGFDGADAVDGAGGIDGPVPFGARLARPQIEALDRGLGILEWEEERGAARVGV